MQFKAVIFAALAALPAVLGASTSGTTTATYSTYYDVPDNSLNGVACSNGDNGLITKGQFFIIHTICSSLTNELI